MTTLTVLAALVVVLIPLGWALGYVFYYPGRPSGPAIGVFSLALIFLTARLIEWMF